MRAELVVELQMRAFAEQVEVEIGQDRRKPVGVLDLDLALAEARAQRDSVGEPFASRPANRPASWMRCSVAFVPCSSTMATPSASGQEDAHDRHVAFDVRAEIVERVGVTTLDDRIGFGRACRAHSACGASASRSNAPGAAQAERAASPAGCASSYSIS